MVAAMANTTDPEHITGEVLRLGTIASVDHAAATCTVAAGDITTGDLPWIAQRAAGARPHGSWDEVVARVTASTVAALGA